MSENGEIYTAGKNFTLPPAVTGVTNSTSALTFELLSLQQKMLSLSLSIFTLVQLHLAD